LDKPSKYYRGQSEERNHEEDALPGDVEQAAVNSKAVKENPPPAQVLLEALEASAYQMKLRRLRRFKRFRRLLEEYGLGIQRVYST